MTLDLDDTAIPAAELLAALQSIPEAQLIFTGINADPGNRKIEQAMISFAEENRHRVTLVKSLGQQRYLSLLREADVVIGNSSSGIIEAPAVGTPTVNIGPRQRGRLRAASVIDCADDRNSIGAAIRKAMSADFRRSFADAPSPYGTGGASRRIRDRLRDASLNGILMKRFHDLHPLGDS